MFAHLQFVDWCSRQDLPVNFDSLGHLPADLLFDDFTHRFGNELQIALVGDAEFNFVPNVGKKRPGIIPNHLIEDLFVWKPNYPPARMISRDILTAELPERGVEVTHVNDVACSVPDFYSIADPEWLADQNVNPCNETLGRRLDRQSKNDGPNPKRGERAVPVNKNNRNRDDGNDCSNDQEQNSPQGEARYRLVDSSDRVHPHGFRNCQDDNDERGTTDQSVRNFKFPLVQWQKSGAEEVIENGAADKQQCMRDKPELICAGRFDCFTAACLSGLPKFLFDLRPFTQFFSGFGWRHQL